MSKKITIGGVHGVGKSTVIKELAHRLEKAGHSVYVFPEMSYIPQIKIKTYEFQHWFKKQILIRDELVNHLMELQEVDFILVDRHLADIEIYTQELAGVDKRIISLQHQVPRGEYVFFLNNTVGNLLKNLAERDEMSSEDWRKDWKEKEEVYLGRINNRFLRAVELYNKTFANERCKAIANIDLKETVDEILWRIF